MTILSHIWPWSRFAELEAEAVLLASNEAFERHHKIRYRREALSANDRLRRIIAQETPGANATVKRIVAIAKGER